jgi:hypothetical protein
VVHDTVPQGQGQDRQGRITARPRSKNTHVQLFGVQGSVDDRSHMRPLFPCSEQVANCDFRCLDTKIVYRRYASLFFIAGCSSEDNELITLEIIHRYVEQMDKYYGNVCELDIIFSFTKAYYILDELLLAGELQESSKKNVLRCIGQQDSLEDMEVSVLLSLTQLHRTDPGPFPYYDASSLFFYLFPGTATRLDTADNEFQTQRSKTRLPNLCKIRANGAGTHAQLQVKRLLPFALIDAYSPSQLPQQSSIGENAFN